MIYSCTAQIDLYSKTHRVIIGERANVFSRANYMQTLYVKDRNLNYMLAYSFHQRAHQTFAYKSHDNFDRKGRVLRKV